MQKENFSIPEMNARHYASTPDGQLCFILALKVCEGVQDIAHNIYTSSLSPQDCCLNGPHGGPEVGREGTTVRRQPPACVYSYSMCANYSLTDRKRSLTGHSCLADAIHKCFTPAWRQWTGLRWGLGLTAQLDQSQGGKYRSHGSGERINITFICQIRVTTARQAAYEYWEKVCKTVSVFWIVTIYFF